jgi:hypothetical protein
LLSSKGSFKPQNLNKDLLTFISNIQFRYYLYPTMALTVKTSQLPNSGKGLFTTTAIKKGTRIIEYLGEIIDWKEYEKRVERDEDGYLFFINKKVCIDAWNTLNIKHVTQMMQQD